MNSVKMAQYSAALFVHRIRAAGFDSYADYLRSDHWKYIKEIYRASSRPKCCFGCGDSFYQLHHVSYVRLGHENLNDVLPLCRDCHVAIHSAENPRAPYEIMLLARFFYPSFTKKQLKRKVAAFTNRNISRKRQHFKNSGLLVGVGGD